MASKKEHKIINNKKTKNQAIAQNDIVIILLCPIIILNTIVWHIEVIK